MKLKFALSLVVATLLVFASSAQAGVWTATASWSPEVELNYQAWVRTSWTKNVFDNPGPLQNVKLDCADAVYSMRLLFAYENKLPFAVKDPSSNRVISNDMNRFNSIQDDGQRFRAFALYLYDILGTTTLAEDSYPIAMNRTAIHSGVFLKTDHATHHSWTVRDLDQAGIPYLLFASRPARTTLLDRHYYPTMGFLWGQQDLLGHQVDSALQTPGDAASGVGFRMYRYPADVLKPEWQVPGYSLEQFQMKRISWAHALQHALQLTQETPEQLSVRLLGEACKEASDRVSVVLAAAKAKAAQSPSYCFNPTEYDDLSTPSKDARSYGVFQDLVHSYASSNKGLLLTPPTRTRLEDIVLNHDPGTYCPLQISSSTRMTLGEAVRLSLGNKWSSNPNDSLLARWGREPSPTPHAASCPTY